MNGEEKKILEDILDRVQRYKDRYRNANDLDNVEQVKKVMKELKKCKELEKALDIEKKFKNQARTIQMSKFLADFLDEQGKPEHNLNNLLLFIFLLGNGSTFGVEDMRNKILEFDFVEDGNELPLFQVFIKIIGLNSLQLVLIDDNSKHYMEQQYSIREEMFEQFFKIRWQEYLLLLQDIFKDLYE